MGFLGVYKAIYDYAPQSQGELSISEGDVLYVLEKSNEDDWWKAKKRASADEEDEPVGLVPNNYVEKAPPVGQARSLYEYTRQTDEELSFPEDAQLQVFDTSDPDWILVGFEGDYGFVPANYIEITVAAATGAATTTMTTTTTAGGGQKPEPTPVPEPPSLPARSPAPAEPVTPRSPPLPERNSLVGSAAIPATPTGPAAVLAGVISGKSSTRAATPPSVILPPRQQYRSEESDGEPSPALPARPQSQSVLSNEQPTTSAPPQPTLSRRDYGDDPHPPQSSRIAPGGFHMYNINEMVSVMGKKKKMPTTLGINLKTGVILIAPERAQDGPTQEWTADKMTHYSREGKHVFLELVRPSKSIDFHAGAKDTAEEIVSALGELSGAVRAEGLREVIMAGTGQSIQKRGQVLYDFMAQGDDEVTVAVGDEVIIIDDSKSEEWWQVRRLKNGKEGVVPSSYIEVTETIASSTTSSINAGRSTVAQNRLEEERLTKEALKKDQRTAEVGPGMRLPERNSSLLARNDGNTSGQQRNRRENGRAEGGRSSSSKPKPDLSKVRTWTDRSKSFSVEAQFLGLKDGKINLHKMNGVKIAVPVSKMSIEDIEYVERILGVSLDEDKPLSEVKRAKASKSSSNRENTASKVGATIEPAKPDYDWFQFFLSCDIAVGLCERYAQAFAKDSMDESVLPDVDAGVLRNLGLREGDIIKVMRYLDKRFGREGKKRNVSFAGDEDGDGSAGGLFSGPGGTLRNNTRKGRPTPPVQTNDNVDAKTFAQQKEDSAHSSEPSSPTGTRPKPTEKNGGFDDDAWDVKPTKQPDPEVKAAPTPESNPTPVQPQRPPTQAMQDLSLLTAPLEPTKVQPNPTAPSVTQPPPPPQLQPQAQSQQTQPQSQPQGATPSFFTGISQQQTGISPTAAAGVATPSQPLNLGLGNRQRPIPPQITGNQGALMLPPPPARPLSAPQSVQPSGFAPPPLQPQMTGITPPGQSLNELNQQRIQQQYMGGFQVQPTGQGVMPFNTGAGIQHQPGFGPGQFVQPQMTGAPQIQSPFADPRPQQFSPIQNQPTGFPGVFPSSQQFSQQGGINSFLPPALEPQRTGMPLMQPQLQAQPTGFGGFGQGFSPGVSNTAAQQPPAAPLQPQKTGPAPPVRFGVTDKIAPQPTGRRANLAQATPQNPFGF
ncbi:cytoskeletal protein binding protein [Parahypoxylon ruwenzoriense]